MNQLSLNSPIVIRTTLLITVILLILSGARATNALMGKQTITRSALAQNGSPRVTKENKQKINYSQLETLHLFGQTATKQARVERKQEIKTPETRLKLELIGVIFNKNSHRLAIISEQGGQQKAYSEGDMLPSNATLYAIEQHRIILERNNKRETLSLNKPELQSKALGQTPSIPVFPDDMPPNPSMLEPITRLR